MFFSLDLETVRESVHRALKAWHQVDGTPVDFLDSLLLVQECRKVAASQGTSVTGRSITNEVLSDAIKDIAQQDILLAEVLELRFKEGFTGRMAAGKLNLSLDQVNRRQRQGIDNLSQILWQREMTLRQERCDQLEADLPPSTYSRLFGVDKARKQLVEILAEPEGPCLVAIVGGGGIGKTALADAVTRQMIRHFCFDQVLWVQVGHHQIGWGGSLPSLTLENLVTALAQKMSLALTTPPERMKQVRQALKARPHLVVIDNLEAEMDLTYLLAHLANLAQPSKFLLTARMQPPPELEVFTFPLHEITAEDTIALLRHYATVSRATHLAEAAEGELRSIYAVTGGNPLAVKLVAGLVSRNFPLPHILANLERNLLSSGESLYQRIYWKTWHTLSRNAQTLLLAMPLAAESGVTLEQMQAMSALSEKQVWSAMTELIARSLMEARGTLHQPRYAIHRLTDSFLRAELVHVVIETGNTETEDELSVSSFAEYVAANLVYWRSKLEIISEQTLNQLDVERHNLIRAVQFGLEWPHTWQAAVSLSQEAFTFVERRGYWREWISLLESIIAVWQGEKLRSKCILLNQLGHLLQLNRQLPAALEAHRKSEMIAQQLGDESALALARFHLSADYYQMRQFEESAIMGEMALAGLDKAKEEGRYDRQIAATLNQSAITARALGDLTRARARLSEAVSLWQRQDQPTELARALQNLAIVLEEVGEEEAALAHYERAVDLLAQTNNEVDKARVALSLGTLHYNQQAWSQAQAAFEEAAKYLGKNPAYVYFRALAANNLGSVLLEQNRLAEAEQVLHQAIQFWHQADDNVSLANTLGALGKTLIALGQAPEALSYYDEAIRLLQMHPNDARARKYYEEITTLRAAVT